MKIAPKLLGDWPKLAWTAVFDKGSDTIVVHHGPMVEIGADWLVEAVWAGDFTIGDFDRTDLVFGTGIRSRANGVNFVTAGTMLDRLWHCLHRGRYYVSNSLPAMLALGGIQLREDYDYNEDIKTMREGLHRYRRTLPTRSCDVHVAYYHNLLYDGSELREVEKPYDTPEFRCYGDYFGFLTDTARRLRGNLEDPARRHRIVSLASISCGYDSGASAVIAKYAGCTQAVTISNATTLLPRSDSGLEIARHLGMDTQPYHQTTRLYRQEETVWGIAGRPAGLNLTIFNFPEPLCLFFTGYRGDSIWVRAITDTELFATPSIAGLALCEYRLIQGLFHCVVPFCGSRNLRQIQALNFLPEMEPWTLHRDYDRPIPRRILEEADVPRELFGNRKEVTSAESFFIWPFSRESQASFAAYLRRRGLYAPSPAVAWLLRKIVHLDHLVYVNLTHKFGWHTKGLRFVFKFKGQDLLFHWANEELTRMYVQRMGGSVPAVGVGGA
jgi:hypothetical protein